MHIKETVASDSCTGCRTCELACSYHHKKEFQPSLASIEVGDIEDKIHLGITFYLENEGSHLACDRCKGENQPLCIKYCNAVGRDELRIIWNKCFLH